MPPNTPHDGYLERLRYHCADRLAHVPHVNSGTDGLDFDAHQQEAMLTVNSVLEECRSAFSIVHCCGAGKTLLQVNLIGASQAAKKDLGINGDRKDIVLTTERALVCGIHKEFAALGLDVGVWGGGAKILDRPILIANAAALHSNRRSLRYVLPPDRTDLVIGDEADLFLTKKRRSIIDSLGGVLRAGFTATPRWPDGRDISEVWGPKIHHVSLKQGILRGINTPPLYQLFEAHLDESNLKIAKGDYDPHTLSAALKAAEVHKAVPEVYRTVIPRENRHDFPTLVYVPSTNLVRAVTDTLREQLAEEGVRIEQWIGDELSTARMQDDMAAFNDGKIDILVLCEMGGRGMDLPRARFLIDAYPTLSATKLEQRHGRVLRRVREHSAMARSGFLKSFSIIAQIVPKANRYRPILLTDILEGWNPLREGDFGGGHGLGGGVWQKEVEELRRHIESKKPPIHVSRIKDVNLYQEYQRRDALPRASADGFLYIKEDEKEVRCGTPSAWSRYFRERGVVFLDVTIKHTLQQRGVQQVIGLLRGKDESFYREPDVRWALEFKRKRKDGNFTVEEEDGQKVHWGTPNAWSMYFKERGIDISNAGIRERLRRAGVEGKRCGPSEQTSVLYAEHDVFRYCAELLRDDLPEAGIDEFLQIERDGKSVRAATGGKWRRMLHISDTALKEKLQDKKIRGKLRGHVRTFYIETDVHEIYPREYGRWIEGAHA